jgi:hypothetical protein
MQRYNSFNLIHKTLRHMLYDAAVLLQQTNFAETAESNAAIEKIETVVYFFVHHAHHEDNYVLPAVKKYDAALVASFEDEYEKYLGLGNKLKNLINIYRNVNFEEERMTAGSAICKAFIDFMIFNLEHMSKEEILINQVLWQHYTDEQLLAINQQIVANIQPEEMAFTSKWMIRSINNKEAIGWLLQVKAARPSFVLQSNINGS